MGDWIKQLKLRLLKKVFFQQSHPEERQKSQRGILAASMKGSVVTGFFNGLKFNEQGLIPAIIQDINTGEILMHGYMNMESLKISMDTGKATFWSRSRKKLWTKGETSGNFLNIKELYYDCDMDTLLFKVTPKGPTCHTGNRTCFFSKVDIPPK